MRLIPKRPHLPRVRIPMPSVDRMAVLELAGLSAIIVGVGLIYIPAGVILGGASVFVVRGGQVYARRRDSS